MRSIFWILLLQSLSIVGQVYHPDKLISVSELLDSNVTIGSFLELDIAHSPVSISVINAQQIQNSGARHLSELLELYVPGFQYLYNKWNGIIWGMRGVAADRNTKFIFLVNGHKMNHESRDGAFSELDLGFLSDLERVEVLRGPAGLVYGSGSIAGVINLVTKKRASNETMIENGVETWGLNTFGTMNKFFISRQLGNEIGLSVYGGFRISQGSGLETPRIYGRPSWPYPQWYPDPPREGVPAQGSSWDTPGNFLLSADLQTKTWRYYGRFTRQVSNAAGLFVLDPWPEVGGVPDSTADPKFIDGKPITRDGFWGNTESWGNSRRQYQVTNISLQSSRDFYVGSNYIKVNAGVDLVSSRIVLRQLKSFQQAIAAEREMEVAETFGERRFNLTGTYIIKRKHFNFASGLDCRLFVFGNDLSGKNSQQEKLHHPIVDNVTYYNQAVFSEGVINLRKWLFDLGIRYDVHSRTLRHGGFLNTRIGMVYQASKVISLRLIHQSSGNNGSVDCYEFNRNNFNDQGQPYTQAHYENPTVVPSENSVPIDPVSLSDLRKLKPEKAYSWESSVYVKHKNFNLCTSLSYNTIKDLFTWNQASFRVLNAGKYHFVNLEMDIQYSHKNIVVGANHVVSHLVNTNVSNETIRISKIVYQEDTSRSEVIDGQTYYYPLPYKNSAGGDSLVESILYPIREGISVDGKNFLNLSSHVTKIYLDIPLNGALTFSTSGRIFWGLPGRKPIHQYASSKPEALAEYDQSFANNSKYPYLSVESAVMIKWNAGLRLQMKNTTVQFLVYDLLSPQSKRKNVHSLRWQQMALTQAQTDLYAFDFRSYAVKIGVLF